MTTVQQPARRRGRGEGSIFPDGNRWRGAVSWKDDAGKLQRRYVSGRTQAETRRKVAELRAELDRGQLPGPDMTVGDYLTGWLAADRERVRYSTWRPRTRHVEKHLIPAFGALKLRALTPRHVEALMAAMIAKDRMAVTEKGKPAKVRPLSPLTARHVRATLRLALADAQRDGLVATNVAAMARPPRLEDGERSVLTVAHVAALLEATASDDLGPLWAVAVTTGMRQGELLGLDWTDVDLQGRRLVVRRALSMGPDGLRLAPPKTERSRRPVPLPAAAVAALRTQLERQEAARAAAGDDWRGSDAVFADADGRRLTPWHVSTRWRATAARLGLVVTFHDLRHSAASIMLSSSVPVPTVSAVLGHSSPRTTMAVYAHVIPDRLDEGAAAFDAVLEREARR